MDPFDKSNREEFIEYISPDGRTKGRKKKLTALFNLLAVSNNRCGYCGTKVKSYRCEACKWISQYPWDGVPPFHETTKEGIK
jgi:hypothetical protein